MTSDSRAVTTAVEQADATAKLVESRALLTPAADAVTNLLELAKLTNRVLGDVSGGKTSTRPAVELWFIDYGHPRGPSKRGDPAPRCRLFRSRACTGGLPVGSQTRCLHAGSGGLGRATSRSATAGTTTTSCRCCGHPPRRARSHTLDVDVRIDRGTMSVFEQAQQQQR